MIVDIVINAPFVGYVTASQFYGKIFLQQSETP